MSHYFLCSQNKHSKNRRFFQCIVSDFVAANFSKKESRSPRGFLPRPLLRAGESEFRTPPPFPQKNEAGCGQEFFSKKVRANAKITPPFQIWVGSCLGAEFILTKEGLLGIGFRQEIPGGFEFHQKHSRRKAEVRGVRVSIIKAL